MCRFHPVRKPRKRASCVIKAKTASMSSGSPDPVGLSINRLWTVEPCPVVAVPVRQMEGLKVASLSKDARYKRVFDRLGIS